MCERKSKHRGNDAHMQNKKFGIYLVTELFEGKKKKKNLIICYLDIYKLVINIRSEFAFFVQDITK